MSSIKKLEVMQYTGENLEEVKKFIGFDDSPYSEDCCQIGKNKRLIFTTLSVSSGREKPWITIFLNDYILKNCKNGSFLQTRKQICREILDGLKK